MSSLMRNDRRDRVRSSASSARQQWVPRVAPILPAPPSVVDTNPNRRGVEPNGSSVVEVTQQGSILGSRNFNNRGDAGSRTHRGRPPNHRRERESGESGGRERERERVVDRNKGNSNEGRCLKVEKNCNEGKCLKGEKNLDIPQLVQEIQDKLTKGSIECMICYDMVRRSAPVWSCTSCYSIFHLNCIKKWARAPSSIDMSADKNHGSNWRCPGCQSVQLTASKEIRYSCFCGKRHDPPSDFYLTPHSCGEPCGKPLEKELFPGASGGVSKEDLCPHVCVLQCHPGPCPPCRAFASPRLCPCGKKVITTRCSDRKSVVTCGKVCDKLLACQRHKCKRICHLGPCDPCEVLINASCFCSKKSEPVLCGEISVKGEVDLKGGMFSCSSSCGKKLACRNHFCIELCHPGPCGDCGLLPSHIKTCHCGKTPLQGQRSSCLDFIPTCSLICDKLLPCGLHHCKGVCHEGDCSPCLELVSQKCRCGSASRTVPCYQTTSSDENFVCEKPCGKKKNCGRHRCSERCCPLSSSGHVSAGEWNPHFCPIPCGKKLRCGQHSCQSLCHSGHCPPCLETIFADLTCACGRTSIPPPLPCGTPPPSCQFPCSVRQPCGHQSSHSCHFGDCPPCSVPVAKECVGGHVVLRNIPCGSKDIRCNKLCGKTRQCGVHACGRSCHPPPCDSSCTSSASWPRSSCGQTCGAPRRDCKHTCTAPCHPASVCPDTKCKFPVTITCSCGRITASVPCEAGGCSSGFNVDTVLEASIIHKLPTALQSVEASDRIPLGQRKLSCDDECAKVERKRLLADAFDVTPPNLDALHFGENPAVSEDLKDFFRRDPKWVMAVEERCKYLVLGKGRPGGGIKVHVFCAMLKEKRDAIRLIAERWKLYVNAAGREPKRFIVVHVTSKSKVPPRVLGPKVTATTSVYHPPLFDPLVDMDPRLVVALLDLPSDADISALILRFGGECELVWLNDKNALATFSDPARAATAMRRLDRGSVYHGACVVQQASSASVGSALGANAWRGLGVSKEGALANLRGNPWKKAVVKESNWAEDSWGEEEWAAADSTNAEESSWWRKEPPIAASVNRWNILDSDGSPASSSSASRNEGPGKQYLGGGSSSGLPVNSGSSNVASPTRLELPGFNGDEVADDWEKAFD